MTRAPRPAKPAPLKFTLASGYTVTLSGNAQVFSFEEAELVLNEAIQRLTSARSQGHTVATFTALKG